MNMLYVLIGLALVLLVVAIWALFWAIGNRQFDDLESQGWSVVLDDDRKPPPEKQHTSDQQSGGSQRTIQGKPGDSLE